MIDNPANVDLFIFKYCILFSLKVLVSYYRFRKIFLLARDLENPFDLEVFRYSVESSSSEKQNKQLASSNKTVESYLRILKEEPSCSICSKEYEDGEKVVNFECHNHHFFHLSCINEWIQRSPTCPLCRRGLFQ